MGESGGRERNKCVKEAEEGRQAREKGRRVGKRERKEENERIEMNNGGG